MRSLLIRTEENTVAAVPSVNPSIQETQIAPAKAIAQEKATSKKKSSNAHRTRLGVPPFLRAIRARYIALGMLGMTAAVLGRWIIASQNPVYPAGEAVYPATTAPKWSEMSQPNAATFYQAAADAYHVEFPESVQYGSYGLPEAPLAVQKAAIAQAQPAFALLRQGMQYPYVPDQQTNYYSHADEASGLKRRQPNFIVVRETSRMLAAESHYKGVTGDTAGALSSSLDAIRFGIDSGQGHTLLDGMVGKLVEGIGSVEGVKHIDSLSATEARAGITRLEKMLPQERTFAQIMTAERDWGYEVFRDMFVSGTIKPFWENLGTSSVEEFQGRLAYKAVILGYSKQGLVNEYASQMDKIIARGKMPYQQAARLGEIAPSSNPLVRVAVPNFERAMAQCTRIEAQNKVLLTRLAVQAYKKEHNGQVPATLSALTQGAKPYLTTLPTDPFSATGSKPLRYDSSDGLVYSVGQNGVDESYSGDDSLAD